MSGRKREQLVLGRRGGGGRGGRIGESEGEREGGKESCKVKLR